MEQLHQLNYLKLLAQHYPSIQAASTSLIALTAQLHLPKGTEHFLSDIHGEYEAFQHLLKNGDHPLESTRKAVEEELDIDSETEILHSHPVRMRFKNTDVGQVIQQQIADLHLLLNAYRTGFIKESSAFGS
jgi:fructose-1,6-bisphosphatase